MRCARPSLTLSVALLIGCSHATPVAEPEGPPSPMLTLPQPPLTPIALRLIVAGDGGEPGPVHAASFGTVKVLARAADAPALLLMPGDLTYPQGLPDSCPAARARLQQDYLAAVPSLTMIVVPGNHDHGDLDVGTNPAIAARVAWFDCQEQASVTKLTGWSAESCTCDPRWRAPLGTADVAVLPVLDPAAGRPGLSVVAYDSQKALSHPALVAGELAHALRTLPFDRQALVMAHHPLATAGAHAQGATDQDTGSARYREYARAFTEVVDANPKVLLMVFGHDHSLQYRPGSPPVLVSGAASKMSSVEGPAAPGGFAVGDTPGLATVDLLQNGETRITLIWSGESWTTTLPAPGISVR